MVASSCAEGDEECESRLRGHFTTLSAQVVHRRPDEQDSRACLRSSSSGWVQAQGAIICLAGRIMIRRYDRQDGGLRRSLSSGRALRGPGGLRPAPAGCDKLLPAQDIPIIEKFRCESQKANGSPGVSQPYLGQAGARRLSAAAPDHGGSRGMVLHAVYACSMCLGSSGTQVGLLLITVSLERIKAREGCQFESRSE
jgi:hypothetical protein